MATKRISSVIDPARIKLDWSRLLGFDQASGNGEDAAARKLTDPRLAKLGGKVGNKSGIRSAR